MKTLTYYLPDEKDSPLPPEGFSIIGYRTIALDKVATDVNNNHMYATLALRSLEDNFLFACVASDGNTDLCQGADIRTGLYDGVWHYLDDGEVFDAAKYKEMQ